MTVDLDLVVERCEGEAMRSAQEPTVASKLDLLRRAYRVLKHDFEDRERALAAERASHASVIAHASALAQRAESAEREARELKAGVHARAATALDSIRQRQRPDDTPHREPSESGSAGSGSYQRGMEWADRSTPLSLEFPGTDCVLTFRAGLTSLFCGHSPLACDALLVDSLENLARVGR